MCIWINSTLKAIKATIVTYLILRKATVVAFSTKPLMTCNNLSFIKTTQKTLKPSKKYFISQNGWEKHFIPGNFSWTLSAETWDPSCLKKRLLEKQQSIPNTCDILPLKKIFWCTFQISLKYIKLVIPKILFILALWNFDFYSKITLLPPQQIYHPSTTQQ